MLRIHCGTCGTCASSGATTCAAAVPAHGPAAAPSLRRPERPPSQNIYASRLLAQLRPPLHVPRCRSFPCQNTLLRRSPPPVLTLSTPSAFSAPLTGVSILASGPFFEKHIPVFSAGPFSARHRPRRNASAADAQTHQTPQNPRPRATPGREMVGNSTPSTSTLGW